MTVKTN